MYFITTIDSKKNDTRCVGYYSDFKKAEDCVLDNIFDIHETCYDYAVIENIPEGLYHYDENPIWFEWDEITKRYKRINFPPKFIEKGFVGFSIG